MGYTKKTNPGASNTASIAGDQFNTILDIITGITVGDTTNEWNIKTPTRFGDNSFRLWHLGGSSFAYRFRTSTLTASQDVILPPLTAADTLVFLALGQTILNKVINVVDNSIIATGAVAGDLLVFNGTKYVRLPKGTADQILAMNSGATGQVWIDQVDPLAVSGGIAIGGTATFSGDHIETQFVIDHGLLDPPDIYFVNAVSADALGAFTLSVDTNNITVTYSVPPPDGTDNILLAWGSGYTDIAVSSFSPTTTNVLQNKTISGSNNTFADIPINAIEDFNITAPALGEVLGYDGTNWVNQVGGAGGGSGSLAAGGTALKSGTGAATTFTIAHGLSVLPDTYYVLPTSAAARGEYILSIDATNITVTYPIAPASGTDNLTFVWGCGYVGMAVTGFTPQSANVITNKTVGDFMTFEKVAVPADPSAENIILYNKELNVHNNTLAGKMQIDGAMIEVNLF